VFDQIALGVYYPADSFLHRLRARTKLLALFWVIGFVTAANLRAWSAAPYLALVGLVCVAAALSGVTPGYLWRRLRLLAALTLVGALPAVLLVEDGGAPLVVLGPAQIPYAALLAAALAACAGLAALLGMALLGLPAARAAWRRSWLLRSRGGPIAVALLAAGLLWLLRDAAPGASFALGPLTITSAGARLGARLVAVLLSLYALALLLTLTTTPVALIEGLTLLLGPLRRLGLPVDEFALMALLALRFIPTLAAEIEMLIKAQAARGADFAHGAIRERVESLAALLVPVLQGALRRAADLATALDARGYAADGRQTMLHEGTLAAADYLALAVVALATSAALLL